MEVVALCALLACERPTELMAPLTLFNQAHVIAAMGRSSCLLHVEPLHLRCSTASDPNDRSDPVRRVVRRSATGSRRGSSHLTRRSAHPPGSEQPSDLLRVGLLCMDHEEAERHRAHLARHDGVTVSDAHSNPSPNVWLCIAHSPHEAVALSIPLGPTAKVVLLDVIGALGPEVAALLGFHGYLTRAIAWERQLSCLRSVASGFQDAPDPHAVAFHAAWRRGPLTDEQRRILRMVARGETREAMAEQLGISRPTLEKRITALRRRLDLDRHDSLAAKAERLGIGPP